jgi:antitoxin component HigA of HigAB toxin-antitoxin module
MQLRPIKTEADYREALEEIEAIFDAPPNTPESDRLDILSTLVESYENRHFKIDSNNIAIALTKREQRFLSWVFMEVFEGGSTGSIQRIIGHHVEAARQLRPKVKLQSKSESLSIELTANEWRVMYESLNAVIYGLGPHELKICTSYYLHEACDINLKICVAVWGAYGGMTWAEAHARAITIALP